MSGDDRKDELPECAGCGSTDKPLVSKGSAGTPFCRDGCGEWESGRFTMTNSIPERDFPPCPECPGTHGQHYPDCGIGADERWAERVERYVEARDKALRERDDDE